MFVCLHFAPSLLLLAFTLTLLLYASLSLFSESSMFVYPFKIILKTCGTTTLLKSIHPIINLAREECGLTDLNNCFYSRKNFLDPSKQLYPHTSFADEVLPVPFHFACHLFLQLTMYSGVW